MVTLGGMPLSGSLATEIFEKLAQYWTWNVLACSSGKTTVLKLFTLFSISFKRVRSVPYHFAVRLMIGYPLKPYNLSVRVF